MRRILPLLLASPLLLAAAPAPKLIIDRAEIRPTLGGLGTTAAYFTVRNAGTAPDTLTAVACACGGQAALHKSTMDKGVSRMAATGPVAIPAGGAVTLKPGALHLMLTGLKKPIAAGDSVRMTLTFARAGKLEATFKATPTAGSGAEMGGMDPMAGMHHGG